ncbi:MAG TPA: hypothetical protein VN628_19390 [Vicinamibacterales bacterium]|nr:hypothetical protein [Vicinamibacterales bacterium]
MKRALKIAAVNLAVLLGLVIVIEGGVSLFLFFRDITVLAWESAPYSEYDADLGWIAKRNVSIPDFWKKGVGVRTNSQRFRATYDIASSVAPGKIRVICSGDSFTFGDGVNNGDTWCDQLAARDARVESVNLGQGGYGADQAYLRFLRDARTLAHQVHVFAFIDNDFKRMQSTTFLGIDKPVLTLEHGVLAAGNVPVPRRFMSHMWLNSIPRALLETRSGVFARRVLNKFGPDAPSDADKDAGTKAVLRAMFADLKRVNEQRGSRLFLAHLPTLDELGGVDPWTPFLEDAARAERIPLIDVLAAFRARTDAKSLFLYDTTAASHYNAAGHALVADEIGRRINTEIAGISERQTNSSQ